MINGNACFADFNKNWGISLVNASNGIYTMVCQNPPRCDIPNKLCVRYSRSQLRRRPTSFHLR
jgi:hypothetical protein